MPIVIGMFISLPNHILYTKLEQSNRKSTNKLNPPHISNSLFNPTHILFGISISDRSPIWIDDYCEYNHCY